MEQVKFGLLLFYIMSKRKDDTVLSLVNENQADNPNIARAIQAKLAKKQQALQIKEQYMHKDYAVLNPQGKKPRGFVRVVAPLTLAEKKAGVKTPTSIQLPKAEYERIMQYLEQRQREAVVAERAAKKQWKEMQKEINAEIAKGEVPKMMTYDELINMVVGSQNYLETLNESGKKKRLFIGDDPQKILNQAIREIGKANTNVSPSRYLENLVWKYAREDLRKEASQKLRSKLSRAERKKYQQIIVTLPKAYTKSEQMRNNFAKIIQSWAIPNVSGRAAQKILAMSGETFVQWYSKNVHNSTDDELRLQLNSNNKWQWDSDQLTDDESIRHFINWLIEVGLIEPSDLT